MEDVLALHANGWPDGLRTAEALGLHADDAPPLYVGKLLITSVCLKDQGLQG
jgi:hypothetical protein